MARTLRRAGHGPYRRAEKRGGPYGPERIRPSAHADYPDVTPRRTIRVLASLAVFALAALVLPLLPQGRAGAATSWVQQPIDTTGPVWSATHGWVIAPLLAPQSAITTGGWWLSAGGGASSAVVGSASAVDHGAADTGSTLAQAFGTAFPPGTVDLASSTGGGGWTLLGEDTSGRLGLWPTDSSGNLGAETPIAPPNLSATSYPLILACLTTTTCWLAGNDPAGNAVVDQTTNDGTTWSAVALPVSGPLYGLSCPSSTDCAVLLGGSSPTLLVTQDSGTTWAQTPGPSGLPAVPPSDQGLACVPGYTGGLPTQCWAATTAGVAARPFVGGSWTTAIATPTPPIAVDCGDVIDCGALAADSSGQAVVAFGVGGPGSGWTWTLSPAATGVAPLLPTAAINFSPLAYYNGQGNFLGRQISGPQQLVLAEAANGSPPGWTYNRLESVPVPPRLSGVSLGSQCAAIAGGPIGQPFALGDPLSGGPETLGPAATRLPPGLFPQTFAPSAYSGSNEAVWCDGSLGGLVTASPAGVQVDFDSRLFAWPSAADGEQGNVIMSCDDNSDVCVAGSVPSSGPTAAADLLVVNSGALPPTATAVPAPAGLASLAAAPQPLACGSPNTSPADMCLAITTSGGTNTLVEAPLTGTSLGPWKPVSPQPVTDPTNVACGPDYDEACAVWSASSGVGALLEPGGSWPTWVGPTATIPGVQWLSIGPGVGSGGSTDWDVIVTTNGGTNHTTQWVADDHGLAASFDTFAPATSPIECVPGDPTCGAIDAAGWQIGPVPIPLAPPPTTTTTTTTTTTVPPTTTTTTVPPTTTTTTVPPPTTTTTVLPPPPPPPPDSPPPVVLPPVHTGMPWGSWVWWAAAAAIGVAGAGLLVRRRRPHPRR